MFIMYNLKIKGVPIRYQKTLTLRKTIFIFKYKNILSKDNQYSDEFYKNNVSIFTATKLDIEKYAVRLNKLKINSNPSSHEMWKLNNPLKSKAHKFVYAAKRNGTLKAQPCERCGCQRTEAHHEDYNYPLIVMWLCKKCHVERHKELGWGLGKKLVNT